MHTPEDPDIRNDDGTVLAVAGLLDVSEYAVFEMAYERWYGETADPQRLDRLFALYMFDSSVPVWVRHFTREVLSKERDGSFYGSDYLPVRPVASRGSAWLGWLYLVALGVVVAALIWAAHRSQGLFRGQQSCYFPPCYRIVEPIDHRTTPIPGDRQQRDFSIGQGRGAH